MSLSLTGIYEIDLEILLQVPDESLPSICRTNSYINNICNDEYFWGQKLVQKGWQDLFPNSGLTNRELYIHLKTNGGYLVSVSGQYLLYNNIHDAYERFIVDINYSLEDQVETSLFPPLEQAHEIPNVINRNNLDLLRGSIIEIYRLPGGVEVHFGDLNYLMLSIHSDESYNVGTNIGRGNKMYISPNIYEASSIGQPLDTYIFYEGDPKPVDDEEPVLEDKFIRIEKVVPGKSYNFLFDRIAELHREGILDDHFFFLRANLETDPYYFVIISGDEGEEVFVVTHIPVFVIARIGQDYVLIRVHDKMYSRLKPYANLVDIRSIIHNLPEVIETGTILPISELVNIPLSTTTN